MSVVSISLSRWVEWPRARRDNANRAAMCPPKTRNKRQTSGLGTCDGRPRGATEPSANTHTARNSNTFATSKKILHATGGAHTHGRVPLGDPRAATVFRRASGRHEAPPQPTCCGPTPKPTPKHDLSQEKTERRPRGTDRNCGGHKVSESAMKKNWLQLHRGRERPLEKATLSWIHHARRCYKTGLHTTGNGKDQP